MANHKQAALYCVTLGLLFSIAVLAQEKTESVSGEPLTLLIYVDISSKDGGLHDRVASTLRTELRKFSDVEILDSEAYERLSKDSTARRQRYPNCAGPFRLTVLPLETPCGIVMSVICTQPSDPSISSNLAMVDLMQASTTSDSKLRQQESERYRTILTREFGIAAMGMERILHHSVITNGSKDLTEVCRDVVASIDEDVLETWRQVKREHKVLLKELNTKIQEEVR